MLTVSRAFISEFKDYNDTLSGEIDKEIQQFYKAQNVLEVNIEDQGRTIVSFFFLNYYRNLQA